MTPAKPVSANPAVSRRQTGVTPPAWAPRLARILDANLNRAREGLRVAEEIVRLALENPPLQMRLKRLRHAVTSAERAWPREQLLTARAADRDPGRAPEPPSRNRTTPGDLAQANLRRAEEALRVLEEISRWVVPAAGPRFKHLRFRTYTLERDVMLALAASDTRATGRPRKTRTAGT